MQAPFLAGTNGHGTATGEKRSFGTGIHRRCSSPRWSGLFILLMCTGLMLVPAMAREWSSPEIAGGLGRSTTQVSVNGSMTYHDTHYLRGYPSFIFKQVQQMHVHLQAGGVGSPEITRVQMMLRNARTDGVHHGPSITPEDVNLQYGGSQATFTLDPARLVADVGGIVEFGMTMVSVLVEFDIPPFEDGDHVEFAFVLVPRYRASLHTLSESLMVSMGEVVGLEPSSSPYYGVAPVETPAAGYSIEPESGTYFFDPPVLSSETGIVTFDYFSEAGTYEPGEDIKRGEASISLPGSGCRIHNSSLLKFYARVDSVSGDVRIKSGFSPDYVPLQAGALVQPHDIVRMTVRPRHGGGWTKPSLGLTFYDGMRANMELASSHEIADKDVVISFDEVGTITRRHRNFVTDLSDFASTVGENHREYMRIGIKKTLGFLAGKVTGGFGWLASKGAENAVEYAVDRVSESNRAGPQPWQQGRQAMYSPLTSGGSPWPAEPTGAERVWDMTVSLRADGSAYVENKGATVDLVSETHGGSGTRMGGFSRAKVDLQNERISQAAALPPMPHLPHISFLFDPPGAVVPTATPQIDVTIPFPDSVHVYPRTLECRLNGTLISPWMRYRWSNHHEVATYQIPRSSPLPEGQNTIEVSVLRTDGVRYEAASTFTVHSSPRTPGGLRPLNGRNRISLRWDANPETYITGYRIYRSSDQEVAGNVVGETTQPVFVDGSVTAGQTYWYSVQAIGPGHASALSGPVAGSLNPAASLAAPDAPPALTAVGLNQAVQLQFDDTAWNAVGWRLERGPATNGPFALLLAGELLAVPDFVDRQVTNGSTYAYRLAPEGMDGQLGLPVLSGPVTPAMPGPRPPAGLTAHRVPAGVRLRWDPPPEDVTITAHRLYAFSELTGEFLAATVPAPGLSTNLSIQPPGVYAFAVRAVGSGGQESEPGGAVLLSLLLESPIVYVNPASPSPTPPYTTWATAARDIQSAIDAADDGHTILVTNGVYNTGGRAVFAGMLNRVVVDKAVTVRSVHGPAHTVIEGALEFGSWGDTAIRAVYLGAGATLDGFTVRNGGTRGWGYEFDPIHEQSGGGAWCEAGATIRNSLIVSNYARYGGGVYGAQPHNGIGGIFNTVIRHNRAMDDGGGLNLSTAYNTLITHNEAWTGGGGFSAYLYNCTVTTNHGYQRGGIAGGTVVNSIVHGNTDNEGTPNWGGGNVSMAMSYSCTVPAITGTGNLDTAPLFINAAGGDFRLAAGSPCIDAGTNQAWMGRTTDLAANHRIIAGRVDMGAYESIHVRDTDQDGIPDWWEQHYFGDPTAAHANAMAANRQNTLRQAFIAGLDPHDPSAFFSTHSVAPSPKGFEIRWTSAEGRIYRVERSTNLIAPQGGFVVLESGIAATPPENALVDAEARPQERFFYRVIVTTP